MVSITTSAQCTTRIIISLDNASYHLAKKELLPRRGWGKKDIQDWLHSKHIPYNDDMIINELPKLVEPLMPQLEAKKINEMAEQAGHKVLCTPAYHCELNPIEFVGSFVCRYCYLWIAAHDLNFHLDFTFCTLQIKVCESLKYLVILLRFFDCRGTIKLLYR